MGKCQSIVALGKIALTIGDALQPLLTLVGFVDRVAPFSRLLKLLCFLDSITFFKIWASFVLPALRLVTWCVPTRHWFTRLATPFQRNTVVLYADSKKQWLWLLAPRNDRRRHDSRNPDNNTVGLRECYMCGRTVHSKTIVENFVRRHRNKSRTRDVNTRQVKSGYDNHSEGFTREMRALSTTRE